MSNILIDPKIEDGRCKKILDHLPCDVWYTSSDISDFLDMTPHQIGNFLGYMKRLGLVESNHETRQSGYPLKWRKKPTLWRRKK